MALIYLRGGRRERRVFSLSYDNAVPALPGTAKYRAASAAIELHQCLSIHLLPLFVGKSCVHSLISYLSLYSFVAWESLASQDGKRSSEDGRQGRYIRGCSRAALLACKSMFLRSSRKWLTTLRTDGTRTVSDTGQIGH